MYLVYIDDAYRKGYYCFSALAIHDGAWRDAFDRIKQWRHRLRDTQGILVHKELHAVELVAGRGRISSTTVGKWHRCGIYKSGLALLTTLPTAKVFNACSSWSPEQSFERLLNRINRTMQAWNDRAILICDEGDEPGFTRLARKMHVYNPIPSQFGAWQDGKRARHIPIERIVEDPIFKKSNRSYFVQLADFCAYAILQKENPHPARKRYGLHESWQITRPLFVTQASPRDPDGIIR